MKKYEQYTYFENEKKRCRDNACAVTKSNVDLINCIFINLVAAPEGRILPH